MDPRTVLSAMKLRAACLEDDMEWSVADEIEHWADQLEAALINQPATALLRRLSQWDGFDTAADGQYWRREIQRVLEAKDGKK